MAKRRLTLRTSSSDSGRLRDRQKVNPPQGMSVVRVYTPEPDRIVKALRLLLEAASATETPHNGR
jgi:hypothetical protein